MLRSLLSFGRTGANDYLFPKVDPKEDGPDCSKDCADCTIQFPSKVKVENSRPLYGHIKEFHSHVLVATGQSDWKEKVEKESGSLMEAFDSAKSELGVCSFISKSGLVSANTSTANYGLSVKHQSTRRLNRRKRPHQSNYSAHSTIFHIHRLRHTSRCSRPNHPIYRPPRRPKKRKCDRFPRDFDERSTLRTGLRDTIVLTPKTRRALRYHGSTDQARA